jgi:serine/threonine-protein kinase
MFQMEGSDALSEFRLGEWLVQPGRGRISRGGVTAHLRPELMRILVYLARNAGRAVAEDEVAKSVQTGPGAPRSGLCEAVSELQRVLGDDATNPSILRLAGESARCLISPVDIDHEPAVAVLSLQDLPRKSPHAYLSEGMADEIAGTLTRLRGLRVIARSSARALEREGLEASEIGRRLSADAVLHGSVRRNQNRLRGSIRLLDSRNGRRLWSDRFDCTPCGLAALRASVARAVADGLGVPAGTLDESPPCGRAISSMTAYDLYLKGRHLARARDPKALRQAVECFEQALASEPEFAQAHSALGESFIAMGAGAYLPPQIVFPRAEAAAARALELDPALAEAQAVMGCTAGLYEWNWREAESRFLRAETLCPSCVLARSWHATLLACLGRGREAVAEGERALRLDPLSGDALTALAVAWNASRDTDRAIECLKAAIDANPEHAAAHLYLGHIYYSLGRLDEAAETLERAASAFPMGLALLSGVHRSAGRIDQAREAAGRLERRAAAQYVGPATSFVLRLGWGDLDGALDWLERSVEAREGMVPFLVSDPSIGALRSHPRFSGIRDRLRLPAPA